MRPRRTLTLQPAGGTVYRVTTSGEEKVLHHFGHGSDGAQPIAGLMSVRGTLYGTTRHGGSSSACGQGSITTTGTEKVFHSFTGGADGEIPGYLNYFRGLLYGYDKFVTDKRAA